MARRKRSQSIDSEPTPPARSPYFIPLTQADLDRGLSEEQIARLCSVLNVRVLFQELYRLGVQAAAEAETQQAGSTDTP